jgi:translation initiation factor 2 alpha subunit (eIF-2alpha)
MPSKKTSLRFKQTQNADELMSEIMKKDKANMEKILKDTRKTPLFAGR